MIKGSCFNLRHVKKDDLPQLVTLLNDPEPRGEFLSLEVILPGMFEKKFEEESRSKEIRETFLIVDENDVILGQVFHFKSMPYFNSRELGYGLFSREQRGKGIMSEAVRLLSDYLFNTLLINRLEIHTHIDNIASQKVALRCGYQKEGIARGAVFSRGKHFDIAMYALLRQEWEAR